MARPRRRPKKHATPRRHAPHGSPLHNTILAPFIRRPRSSSRSKAARPTTPTAALDGVAQHEQRPCRPRAKRDAAHGARFKGRATGPQKGGKGKRLLGGVIAIKNTWNNTLVSISNSSYKQLGRVTAGSARLQKVEALVAVRDREGDLRRVCKGEELWHPQGRHPPERAGHLAPQAALQGAARGGGVAAHEAAHERQRAARWMPAEEVTTAALADQGEEGWQVVNKFLAI